MRPSLRRASNLAAIRNCILFAVIVAMIEWLYFPPLHGWRFGPIELAISRVAACVLFWLFAVLVGYSACAELAEKLIPRRGGEASASHGRVSEISVGLLAGLATMAGFLFIFWPSISQFFTHLSSSL